jgi:hypothetical protein
MSPVSRLCSCLPSSVPCRTSHVPLSGLPSSTPCLKWSVPCLPSSFLRPLSPINCPGVPFLHSSIPLFLSYFLLFPVLFSSCLLSFVFHTCENASFFKKIYFMHTFIVGAIRADMTLVTKPWVAYNVRNEPGRLTEILSHYRCGIIAEKDWLDMVRSLRDV